MITRVNALTRIVFGLLSLALATWLPTAQAQTTQPKFEYLMTYKAILEPPQVIDNTLYIFNVLPGGWAKGPNISASFIPPGADWLRVMPSGVLRLDVTCHAEDRRG